MREALGDVTAESWVGIRGSREGSLLLGVFRPDRQGRGEPLPAQEWLFHIRAARGERMSKVGTLGFLALLVLAVGVFVIDHMGRIPQPAESALGLGFLLVVLGAGTAVGLGLALLNRRLQRGGTSAGKPVGVGCTAITLALLSGPVGVSAFWIAVFHGTVGLISLPLVAVFIGIPISVVALIAFFVGRRWLA
jgi:hypothetical protein